MVKILVRPNYRKDTQPIEITALEGQLPLETDGEIEISVESDRAVKFRLFNDLAGYLHRLNTIHLSGKRRFKWWPGWWSSGTVLLQSQDGTKVSYHIEFTAKTVIIEKL
jgi:hypothetical protein